MKVLLVSIVAAGLFLLFAGESCWSIIVEWKIFIVIDFTEQSYAIPFLGGGGGGNSTETDEEPIKYSMKQQLALRGIKLSMKASAKMVRVAAGMVSKALEIIDKVIPSPPPSKFDSWTNITNPLSSFFAKKPDTTTDDAADSDKPLKDAETDGILSQYMPSFFG